MQFIADNLKSLILLVAYVFLGVVIYVGAIAAVMEEVSKEDKDESARSRWIKEFIMEHTPLKLLVLVFAPFLVAAWGIGITLYLVVTLAVPEAVDEVKYFFAKK